MLTMKERVHNYFTILPFYQSEKTKHADLRRLKDQVRKDLKYGKVAKKLRKI